MKHVVLKLKDVKTIAVSKLKFIILINPKFLCSFGTDCIFTLDDCVKAEIRSSKKKGNIRRPYHATFAGQLN